MAASYLAVITLTIAFTFIFVMAIATVDIEAIRADWPNRRCEVPAMLGAAWFKPTNDTREGNAFAQENFNFCMSKLASDVLKGAFAPLVAVAGQQVSAQNTTQGPINNLRGMLNTAKNTFMNLFKEQYRKFSFIGIQASRIWLHLQFAMNRMSAIVISIVYFGLSLMMTIQNLIDFTMLVIYIFIGIMVALIIVLFFVLFPFIPLIITVLSILVGAGIGAAAGMAGAFCVDPDAPIVMADHTEKLLKEICIGDHILGDRSLPNIVTGVLTTDASKDSLVEIQGVLMSGTHRVFYHQKWILARDHPEARKSETVLPRLICLNTTQHLAYVKTTNGHLGVGDWEEITTEAGQKAWIDFVHIKLNGSHHKIPSYPTSVPLVSPDTYVYRENLGWIPIAAVKVGDRIKSDSGMTRVIGIYQGEIPTEELPKGQWVSDGVWIRLLHWWSTAKIGITATMYEPIHMAKGLFLVTKDEMFKIQCNGKEMLVRDFTELGASNLESSYSMLNFYLNKK